MEKLEIIQRIIEEHHAIHEQLMATGKVSNDIEAVFTVRQAYANWSQSSVNSLIEVQSQIKPVIRAMEEGLNRHFGFEEQYLPPILGEILMRGLFLEHQQIRLVITKLNVVIDSPFGSMSREEVFAGKQQMQEQISAVISDIEKHAAREETLLSMAKLALETPPDK